MRHALIRLRAGKRSGPARCLAVGEQRSHPAGLVRVTGADPVECRQGGLQCPARLYRLADLEEGGADQVQRARLDVFVAGLPEERQCLAMVIERPAGLVHGL